MRDLEANMKDAGLAMLFMIPSNVLYSLAKKQIKKLLVIDEARLVESAFKAAYTTLWHSGSGDVKSSSVVVVRGEEES